MDRKVKNKVFQLISELTFFALQTFDGVADCFDFSDECDPKIRKEDAFSSRFQLIANPFLRAFVWIMAILAVLGNIVSVTTDHFGFMIFICTNVSIEINSFVKHIY